jgi:hypothetical protein
MCEKVCVRIQVSVQPLVHNMVISEVDHVSSTSVTFMFPELALVIDNRLLHVGIYVMNRHSGNWTDTSYLHSTEPGTLDHRSGFG